MGRQRNRPHDFVSQFHCEEDTKWQDEANQESEII